MTKDRRMGKEGYKRRVRMRREKEEGRGRE